MLKQAGREEKLLLRLDSFVSLTGRSGLQNRTIIITNKTELTTLTSRRLFPTTQNVKEHLARRMYQG